MFDFLNEIIILKAMLRMDKSVSKKERIMRIKEVLRDVI